MSYSATCWSKDLMTSKILRISGFFISYSPNRGRVYFLASNRLACQPWHNNKIRFSNDKNPPNISITRSPHPTSLSPHAIKTTKRMKKNMSTPKTFTMSHRFEVTLLKYLRICSWASSVLIAVSSTLPSMRTCNVEQHGRTRESWYSHTWYCYLLLIATVLPMLF